MEKQTITRLNSQGHKKKEEEKNARFCMYFLARLVLLAASAEAVSPRATENANGKFDAAKTATGRPVDPAQVRHDALGRGDNRVGVPAVPQHRREQPELAGGAGFLAGEPLAAERGLGVGDRGELAAGHERVGYRL